MGHQRLGGQLPTPALVLGDFNAQDQPQCTYCDCASTVVHILLECPHYSIVRQRYFSITTLKDLFETVNTHTILDFIKEIGFYNRI